MRRARVATLFLAAALLALPGMPAAAGAPADDPGFPEQWNLPIVGAPEAWEKGAGRGITIAVVDTGVDLGHEDLTGQVARHVSCIGAGGDPAKCRENEGQDDHGHGTHVAGVAAASTSNRTGVAAMAPGARVMAVRVLRADEDDDGGAQGAAADVEAGIRWAVEHGADVVNLSLGEKVAIGDLTLPLQTRLADAIEDAWAAGVIPVIAAGNSESLFGSGYRDLHALVVTATTRDDVKASYATGSGDARWGMAAPGGAAAEEGEGILSTWLTADAPYAWSAGTSMATPHVSGGAAVLRSLGLSPQQTVARLLVTAHDIGAAGNDRQTGNRLARRAPSRRPPRRRPPSCRPPDRRCWSERRHPTKHRPARRRCRARPAAPARSARRLHRPPRRVRHPRRRDDPTPGRAIRCPSPGERRRIRVPTPAGRGSDGLQRPGR